MTVSTKYISLLIHSHASSNSCQSALDDIFIAHKRQIHIPNPRQPPSDIATAEETSSNHPVMLVSELPAVAGKRATYETVEGPALALERIDNIERRHSLALGMLSVCDGIADAVSYTHLTLPTKRIV